MTEFKSSWMDWEPTKSSKSSSQRTDKTDISPSVTYGERSTGDISEKSGLKKSESSIQQVDISDRSPFSGPATPVGAVAAKSTPPPRNLVADDWRDFYEERAAILEYDGGLPREQSERLAFEAAVAGLSNAMPADYPKDACAACGKALGRQGGLSISDGEVVCDAACHLQHRAEQRERAIRQLNVWDIRPAARADD